jgi:hypothetical protein
MTTGPGVSRKPVLRPGSARAAGGATRPGAPARARSAPDARDGAAWATQGAPADNRGETA